jgi:predicted outer membrane repeat protein
MFKKYGVVLLLIIVISSFSMTIINAVDFSNDKFSFNTGFSSSNPLSFLMGNVGVSGNFTNLTNAISTSNEVFLTDDVSLSNAEKDKFKDGINVNNNLVIDGQGHTINARGLARIFNVTKGSITIKNINLINGNGTNGGAIYSMGNVTVINSNFINNAANDGGAIYSMGKLNSMGNVTVIDSNFTSNKASYNGGAISSGNGSVNLINSNFINNTANDGSAIYSNIGSVSLINSNLDNNLASSSGGAIYSHGKVNILNSKNHNYP